jgi:hypothetical protein
MVLHFMHQRDFNVLIYLVFQKLGCTDTAYIASQGEITRLYVTIFVISIALALGRGCKTRINVISSLDYRNEM